MSIPESGKPELDLLVSTWGTDGPVVRKKDDKKREKIIQTVASIIGTSCTCSGRPDRDKNIEMATKIVVGLEKRSLI